MLLLHQTAVIGYCFVFFFRFTACLYFVVVAFHLLFVPGRHPLVNSISDGVFPAARPLQMPLQYESSGRPVLGIIIVGENKVAAIVLLVREK